MTMEQQTINTMTITLEEYKRMIEEVSNLQSKVEGKEERIKSLANEIGRLENDLYKTRDEIERERTVVTVIAHNPSRYSDRMYLYGVQLSKESPELVEIIKTSIDGTMETTIKNLEKKVEELKDELERSEKMSRKNKSTLIERHETEVKELNKTIETLTQDLEDLKLDKAANIVEAERLNEVIRLKEEIAELESIKDIKEVEPWIDNKFARKFFKKLILKAARDITSTEEWRLECKKRRIKEDATSPIGKAKDYLKTLNSNNNVSKNTSSQYSHLMEECYTWGTTATSKW